MPARTPRTIYIVRHAIAAERGEKYPDDAKRPLTHDGIARMRQAVRGFSTLDPGIDLVLTSPLVRARHTADILMAGLSPAPALEVLDALAPGHHPPDVASRISGHGGRRVVALVGHEPDLGQLGAWLIGAREPLVFKKGGIARIDVPSLPPGRDGQLVWLATPKMLRGLR
jgi:phosphohistidine phosphatase